jgi:LacI family kdg operon repressor
MFTGFLTPAICCDKLDSTIKRASGESHMKNTGRVTINDIAAAAGVSKTTVSRYINGHTELMSETVCNRIKTIIEMVNYQPSDIARNLKRQSSNLIGVIISDISSPFSSAVIAGISECLEDLGYTPLFANCDDSLEQEQKSIASLLAKGVSGLIVNTTSCDNNYLIDIACKGMPVVLCDRYVKNYNFDIATSRHKQGIYDLVLHLKKQGYTRPVLFTQKWEKNSARYIRRQSFIDSVEQIYGYSPENDIYLVSTKNKSSAYEGLIKLQADLKPNDLPAIVGINSVTTMRVFKAIKKLGLIMPHDIGLCGPEDWDWDNEMNWSTLVTPNITTVVVHSTEIGRQSAKLLLEKVKNPGMPAQEILLPCEISVRQSTLRID